ncbi:MAG: hypothetical protein M3Q07_05465 [Pseudobdellovibrionaceae bacterium]|nr:hypothetical protein [Pseudobdellovibrionaceae bacterium]
MEHDIPASQRDRQLPMIINLRGDEELVDEFNWDADHVMEFLGIKRSRLTQISGKELRVARIRRDRYLRPIYREADVRDYQEWTRATATHQSSSRAIEQAIDSLDDRFSDILVVLQEKLMQYEDRSTALLKKQVHKLNEADFERYQTLLEHAEVQHAASDRHEKKQGRVLDQLTQQTGVLEDWQKELQDMRGLLGSFHQDIRALHVAQQALRRDMEESQAALREALKQQTSHFTESWQALQETLAVLKTGQNQILQQTEKETLPPRPSPIRRTKHRPIRTRLAPRQPEIQAEMLPASPEPDTEPA